MKIRVLALLLVAVFATALLGGCGSKEAANSEGTKADVVTTASLVNEEAALLKALSKDGTWIICTLGDLSTDKELVKQMSL